MACANVDMNIVAEELPLNTVLRRDAGVTRLYQALEYVPDDEAPLQDLLRKQPAVLGMVSGLLSLGVGIVIALYQDMANSLFALFRLPQITGVLFLTAGLVSNQLPQHPELLFVCLVMNCGCLCVALGAAPLMIFDLVKTADDSNLRFQIEVFALSVLLLECSFSAFLCFCFAKEKKKNSLQ